MYYTPSLRTNHSAAPLWGMKPLAAALPSVFTRQLQHRFVLHYDVPCERVRALVPEEFALAPLTRLSIESFVDAGRTQSVQTNYRLQVRHEGRLCYWLLGLSLSSLSGVTTRHLYPLPWHLSAMELQVSRERNYRLSSQSQWANADWEVLDTGKPCVVEQAAEVTDYFVRRDGEIGTYQTIYQPTPATQGRLQNARCDLLTTLGMLSRAELAQPVSVTLQQTVGFEIKPAAYAYRTRLAA